MQEATLLPVLNAGTNTPPPNNKVPPSYQSNPIGFFQSAMAENSGDVFYLHVFLDINKLQPKPSSEDLETIGDKFTFIFESPASRNEAYKTLTFVIGQMYEHGHDLTGQSDQEAARCYAKAAKQGCERSTFAVTQMYLRGAGFSSSVYEHAEGILLKEYDRGNPAAKDQLYKLHTQMGHREKASPYAG
jgi:hypothetical protein